MIIRKVTITLAQTPHLKDEEVEVREGKERPQRHTALLRPSCHPWTVTWVYRSAGGLVTQGAFHDDLAERFFRVMAKMMKVGRHLGTVARRPTL